jgi:hypothetical protein
MRDVLPKESFIGFTSTPIESSDKNTQAVFGKPNCSLLDISCATKGYNHASRIIPNFSAPQIYLCTSKSASQLAENQRTYARHFTKGE